MNRAGLAVVLGLWAGLAVVGPARLDPLPGLCLVRRFSGHECPGCGITRGLAHLARLQPAAATQRNVFTLPVAGLGALALLRGRRRGAVPSARVS